jgi:alpha-beta hydrolase superfamily lysophospholipase
MVKNMKTDYLHINEKIKLAFFQMYSPNSQIGVILIHGLAEHKGRYDYFMTKLYDHNISVFAVDLRGHGESSGSRGDIDDFETYISDLRCFIDYIKKVHPCLKLVFFGHSLGGLIASAYSSRYNDVNLLILSSPLLISPKLGWILNCIPYKLFKFIRFKKRHSESPEMLAYSYSDPLSSNSFTLRLIGVIFNQGISYVIKNLEKITIPVLILGGEYDPLINTSKYRKLSQLLSNADKQLKIYKGVRHRLVQGNHKDLVIDEIITWINSKIE